MSQSSNDRRWKRYAEAIREVLGLPLDELEEEARAVMAVADEEIEQAEIRVDAWQEMAELFRQGLWDVWVALGHDTDGDTGPMPLIAGMGEEGFVRMVLQDAAKWRQESEDDYDADTSRLEAEIDRLRVEVSQLQADLADSEEEVARQYHEAQRAEAKLERVQDAIDDALMEQAGMGGEVVFVDNLREALAEGADRS